MNDFKSFYILVIILFFVYSLSAQNTKDIPKKISSLQKIKIRGALIVGTSADYPPYEFHLLNDKEGDLVGIDIDIAKVIAQELGVKLEIKNLIFSQIFKALESGQIDMAIAGLSPTEERKKVVSFSDVYYQAIQCVLIRKENAERIKTIEDLRGKKVGVQKDSLQEDMARGHIIGTDFDVRDTIEELITILDKGLVEGIILEKSVGDSYLRRNKNFTILKCEEKFSDLLGSAIAVKKGDNDLLKEINRILAKLKNEDKITEFIEIARYLSDRGSRETCIDERGGIIRPETSNESKPDVNDAQKKIMSLQVELKNNQGINHINRKVANKDSCAFYYFSSRIMATYGVAEVGKTQKKLEDITTIPYKDKKYKKIGLAVKENFVYVVKLGEKKNCKLLLLRVHNKSADKILVTYHFAFGRNVE